MDGNELHESLHARPTIVHDAIKGVVHDCACHHHLSRLHEYREVQLQEISRQVTREAGEDDMRPDA